MATDNQGNTYSKVIMEAAASIPAIKVMVAAKKAANLVAAKVEDLLDDNKIVPKKKPPPDIKPKPKPEPDIKPKLKLKPPRDERAKRNPFRLSSNRQPGIEVANTRTNKTLKNEGRFKERLSPTDFDPSTAYSKPIGFAKGGEVKEDKSPNSGMITQRGWGASKKT
tara:strand:- start:1 stop:498 length:498 start_codon:yes stop_codon:yes gene_type:complete